MTGADYTEYIKTIEYRTHMEAKLARDFWFMCYNNKRPDWLDRDSEEAWAEVCFPIETGNGWLELIYSMCRELITEVKSDFCFTQIKEKWGVLTVYYDGHITPYGEEIIHNYEKDSGEICEVCGDKGIVRKEGGYMTLCSKCFKESQE